MIAFIPARGGSKGVAWKNIKPFRGKPLIRWTVDAAKESGVFERVIVSSDADAILDLCNDVERIKRDPQLATDTTPMDEVIKDFLTQQPSDLIMLLQPTSPLRTSAHIRQAASQFDGNTLISVCPIPSSYLKSFVEVNGKLQPIYHTKTDRRQDLPPLYMPNGAIYLFSSNSFHQYGGIPKNNVSPFFMEESLDVDTELDFAYC
jgi:N-acylneuraminate cytidylyltransferase